jgi:hypothetical protein
MYLLFIIISGFIRMVQEGGEMATKLIRMVDLIIEGEEGNAKLIRMAITLLLRVSIITSYLVVVAGLMEVLLYLLQRS